MRDQLAECESSSSDVVRDVVLEQNSLVDSLEASPPSSPYSPSTPSSDTSELENEPPVGSDIVCQPLSSTSLTKGMRPPIHRSSQLAMKVKQEVSDTQSKQNEISCKYQSYDQFRCDTNINSNKTNLNASPTTTPSQRTTIAKQILSVIRNDDFEELLIILRSKPDLNVFIDGQTALHYCLLFGRGVSWCRQLVLNGANPNLSNHDGWHPLHLAAFKGHTEIISYLINCNNNREMTSDVI